MLTSQLALHPKQTHRKHHCLCVVAAGGLAHMLHFGYFILWPVSDSNTGADLTAGLRYTEETSWELQLCPF